MFGAIRRRGRRSWRRATVARTARRSGRHAADALESGPLRRSGTAPP